MKKNKNHPPKYRYHRYLYLFFLCELFFGCYILLFYSFYFSCFGFSPDSAASSLDISCTSAQCRAARRKKQQHKTFTTASRSALENSAQWSNCVHAAASKALEAKALGISKELWIRWLLVFSEVCLCKVDENRWIHLQDTVGFAKGDSFLGLGQCEIHWSRQIHSPLDQRFRNLHQMVMLQTSQLKAKQARTSSWIQAAQTPALSSGMIIGTSLCQGMRGRLRNSLEKPSESS